MADWMPVATLALGSALALTGGLVTEGLRDRRAARKDLVAREMARAERRQEAEIQLLCDLQDAMVEMVRETFVLSNKARRDESWPVSLVSGEVLVAGFRVTVLRVRVSDDQLRDIVEELEDACSDLLAAETAAESDERLDAVGSAGDAVNEKIGELLRLLRRAP